MELELKWDGWYGLNEETPEDKKGKSGSYALLYDSEIYYIGKSSGEKQHVFQESEFRYNALERYLTEKKIPLEYKNKERRNNLDKIVEEHCKRYIGVLLDESKKAYLDSAENLLIYIKAREGYCKGNDKLKKKYHGVKPFELINKGEVSVLSTLGLLDYYVDSEGRAFLFIKLF